MGERSSFLCLFKERIALFVLCFAISRHFLIILGQRIEHADYDWKPFPVQWRCCQPCRMRICWSTETDWNGAEPAKDGRWNTQKKPSINGWKKLRKFYRKMIWKCMVFNHEQQQNKMTKSIRTKMWPWPKTTRCGFIYSIGRKMFLQFDEIRVYLEISNDFCLATAGKLKCLSIVKRPFFGWLGRYTCGICENCATLQKKWAFQSSFGNMPFRPKLSPQR